MLRDLPETAPQLVYWDSDSLQCSVVESFLLPVTSRSGQLLVGLLQCLHMEEEENTNVLKTVQEKASLEVQQYSGVPTSCI